ncbi:hypothetical protein SESBI_15812 [Sesbania bispinosa]|nr:hypothetical protein SESBI_15812 [Sesbania bispinosa]
MSVLEYSARFTQLSRHAPYPITEEMCFKRFVRGLREYIFRSVVGSNCSTFAESAVSQRSGSSGQSFGTSQRHRLDQGRSSRTTFQQRHFGVTSTPCPTCGRLHIGACFGDSKEFWGIFWSRFRSTQQSGRGQEQAGRGQAQVFAMTRQDAQASNAVVTGKARLGSI